MTEWLDTMRTSDYVVNLLYMLLDLTVKSILILSLAGLITAVFRGISAAARHLIWFSALCSLVCLPFLSLVLPSWYVPLVAAPPVSPVTATPGTTIELPTVEMSPAPAVPSVLPFSDVPARPYVAPLPVTPPLPASPAIAPELDVNVVPSPPDQHAPIPAVPAPTGEVVSAASPAPIIPDVDPIESIINADSGANVWIMSAVRMFKGFSWSVYLFVMWIIGVVLVLFQLALGSFSIWSILRKATPMTSPDWLDLSDEVGDRVFLTRYVTLSRSSSITSPMASGMFKPVVLLPAEADHWTEERRRCVLMHEFAHIKRWDCLTQAIAQIGCALYWFNPLSWSGLRHLRTEREKACDDYVLNFGTKASAYATHLIDIARTVRISLLSPIGAVAMAKPSQLEGRVLAILDRERRRRSVSKSSAVLTTTVALFLVFPLAAMKTWAPAASSEESVSNGYEFEDTFIKSEITAETTYRNTVPAPPVVDMVAPDRLRTGETETTSAEEQYQTIDDDKRVQALLIALRDEDEQVRVSAAHTLGEIGKEEAVEGLIERLNVDTSADVRKTAAWALGEIESPMATEALISALGDDENGVRSMAIWALGELGDPRSVIALCDLLSKEADTDIRRSIVWALGEIEDERSVVPLLGVLEDQDVQVRRRAVYALGEIGDNRAVAGLIDRLHDEDPEIRKGAAYALAELDAPSAVLALTTLLNDSNIDTRKAATYALAELEDARATPALIEALKDEEVSIRKAAAYALAEIGDPDAVPGLIDALKDAHPAVRKNAVYGLAHIEDARSVIPLTELLLNDPEMDVRENAAWALGEIGDPRAIDALTEALTDESTSVRRKAAQALGEIDYDDDFDENNDVWNEDLNRNRRSYLEEGAFRLGAAVGRLAANVSVEMLERFGDQPVGTGVFEDNYSASISPDDLVQMRIFNIDQAMIDQYKALGFNKLTIDQLVTVRIHEISPDYVKSIRSLGFDPALDELVQMRVFGIDENYIRGMVSLGYQNLNIDELVQMRVHGIDKDYVLSLQEAGFRSVSTDDLIKQRGRVGP